MNTTVKKLPQSEVEITIIMTPEDIAPYRKKAVKNIGSNVKIDGFRPGHIPEKVLIERFGEPAILEETVQEALPPTLAKVLQSENMSPLNRPNVDVSAIEPLTLVVTFSVFPEVKLQEGWDKKEAKKKEVKVSKKEKDEAFDRIKENFKTRKPVDRAAKKGDFVEIDFEGKDADGVVLDGTTSKRHPLSLGLNTFVPGFEDNLIGMKKDEEKTFSVTFPKEYRAKHLQGKEVFFTAKMLEVQEEVLPEIDEAMAEKLFGEKMSKKELEEKVEVVLLEEKEKQEHGRREEELLEAWTKMAEVEAPRAMIDEEKQNVIANIKQQMQGYGGKWEDYLQHIKKTEKEFLAEQEKPATDLVKKRLVMWKVLQEKSISPTDEEVLALNPQVKPGSEDWDRVAYQAKLKKLFDLFLTDEKEKKSEEKEIKKKPAEKKK